MNDNQLKTLFQTQKKEIADNGFSQKVSRKLPSDSEFFMATHIIWAVAILLMVGLLLYLLDFREKFPLVVAQFFAGFIQCLTLFFDNPKIYICGFLTLVAICIAVPLKTKAI